MKNQKLTVNPDQFSAKAREVWGLLDEYQQKVIQRDYAFKPARNREISSLKKKGVAVGVLVEITGMKRSQIFRVSKGIKFGSDRGLDSCPDEVLEPLNQFTRAMDENLVQIKGSAETLKTLNLLARDLAEYTREVKDTIKELGQSLNDIASGLEEIHSKMTQIQK